MPDELALARGWFLKAESDLNTARRMVQSDGPHDTACFHAQQAEDALSLATEVRKRVLGVIPEKAQP